jgi:hypothetical protein
MTKTYIIIDLEDVTQDMIDACIENSFDTLRHSLDDLQTILKWNGETPASIAALDPVPTILTQEEILAILNDPENGWIEAEE